MRKMNTRPKLYSQRAAAKFVGISLSTFRKYSGVGVVRGIPVNGGGTIVYDERDLVVFRGKINFPTARSKSRQIIRVVLSTYSAEPRNNWLGRIEKAFESRGREVDLSPKDHQVAFVVNNRPAAVDGNTAHDAHT